MNEQEVFDALKYRVDVDEDGTRKYHNSAGHLHRTDGPAIEYPNGAKFWVQNGQLHRTDGPAIVWNDGVKEWWLGGRQLAEDEYNQAVKQKQNV